MPKKIPKKGVPEAHDDLKGFDIRINRFGEIESTIALDKLNAFLNKKIKDKKFSSGVNPNAKPEEEE